MKRTLLALSCAAALLLPSVGFGARGDFIDPTKLHDTVRIRVGEEVAVAFDQRGDRLLSPRRVKGAQKRPSVTLKFFVPPDHKNLLVLVVGSSYPRIVRYRAAARARGYRDFIETNMLPLNPNIPVYEGWSDPYEELILFDFHVTDEKPPKSA
jgi:hypothetical protein